MQDRDERAPIPTWRGRLRGPGVRPLSLLFTLLLVGCPSAEPDPPPAQQVVGEVPVGEVLPGERLPRELVGDSFTVSLVSQQQLTLFADNDERAGDLYIVILDASGAPVAGPEVADYRTEYLNADWGCSTEPANHPPDRPRGCPDNSFIAEEAGVYTVVLAAHDGLEATVGYSLLASSEGLPLTLTPR